MLRQPDWTHRNFCVTVKEPTRCQSFENILVVSHQAAGNAVKKASDNLVKAAQKAAFDAQDDQAVMVKSKMVGGIAQVRQWESATPAGAELSSYLRWWFLLL